MIRITIPSTTTINLYLKTVFVFNDLSSYFMLITFTIIILLIKGVQRIRMTGFIESKGILFLQISTPCMFCLSHSTCHHRLLRVHHGSIAPSPAGPLTLISWIIIIFTFYCFSFFKKKKMIYKQNNVLIISSKMRASWMIKIYINEWACSTLYGKKWK